MQVQFTRELMVPIAAFSHAAVAQGQIFLAAMAGTNSERVLAGTRSGYRDFNAQTEQMFDNMEAILEMLGTDVAHAGRLRIYIEDPRELAAFDSIARGRYCRSDVDMVVSGSAAFPLREAAIELDGFARLPGSPQMLYSSASGAGIRRVLDEAMAKRAIDRDKVLRINITKAPACSDQPLLDVLRACFPDAVPPLSISTAWLPDAEAELLVEVIAAPSTVAYLGLRDGLSDAALWGGLAHLRSVAGASGDAETQTRAVWDMIGHILAAAHLPEKSVIRTSNMLADWRDFVGFNKSYTPRVDWPFPPRTTFQTPLPGKSRVAIEAIAAANPDDVTILQVPQDE